MENKCTLTNEQLTERVSDWNNKLAKSGGKAWTLRIPVDFNYDPDMLIQELIRRYNSQAAEIEQLKAERLSADEACQFVNWCFETNPSKALYPDELIAAFRAQQNIQPNADSNS